MKIDLVLKEGDYLTLDGSKVSMKSIKNGKLLKQRKKSGQIIFTYEIDDKTKFSKPKKNSLKKEIKKEENNIIVEEEEVKTTVEGEEIVLQPRKQAHVSKINLKRNTKFVDDPDIAKSESKLKPLGRVKLKPDAETKHLYVKRICKVCGREDVVSIYEANIYKDMTYRCNNCFG